jgi:hypothetical protein
VEKVPFVCGLHVDMPLQNPFHLVIPIMTYRLKYTTNFETSIATQPGNEVKRRISIVPIPAESLPMRICAAKQLFFI